MVDTTYLMTKVLELGNAGKGLKTSSSREDSDDFRSMLDKNTKKAEQDNKKTDADNTKAESKPETEKTESKEETKLPQAEAEEGAADADTALQEMVQQCMMSNEQKLTLNWAEDSVQTQENTAQAVTEIAGEQTADAEQTGVQSEQLTNNTAAQTAEAPKAAQEGVQQEQGAQQVQAEQPKQEQKTDAADKKQVELQTEGKDTQVTVQKGQESQTPADGEQTELKDQKATETVDAAAMQKAAPEEGELMQVKVGETVNITEPKAAEELADSVLVKVQQNTNEYEMQLNPEELGKIKIKLVIEDGRIHVSMFCENQKAANLLGLTSEKLRGILEERTGNDVYVEVQKEESTPYSEQEKEKEQNGRGYDDSRKREKKDGDAADFMQQLRLGLIALD